MTSVSVDSRDTEDSAADVDRPAEELGDDSAKTPEGFVAQTEDYLRQHPVARVAIAFGIGALLQAALQAMPQRRPQGTETRKPRVPQRDLSSAPPADCGRTHHLGAADMKFTTHHPDGKNVVFKFAWKKRPQDAPETDWSTDQMGFTAVRPNGKHTEFSFKGKTRPIPDKESSVGDSRPGLGWARLEFTSSAPGRRDFKFTWNRDPSDAAAADSDQSSGISPIREGGSAAVSAVDRQEKRAAKKTSKKKASKKSASG
jgi:hypothetical protein